MTKANKRPATKGTTKKKPKGDKPPATPKQLSAAQKKALFESYDAARSAADKAAKALLDANQKKSSTVKAIFDALGSGPFRYKGTILNIVHRKANDGVPDTFYFKSATPNNIEEIG